MPQISIFDSTIETEVSINGLEDGDYVLLVRSIDSRGFEGESAAHEFSLSNESSWWWDRILFFAGALLIL